MTTQDFINIIWGILQIAAIVLMVLGALFGFIYFMCSLGSNADDEEYIEPNVPIESHEDFREVYHD